MCDIDQIFNKKQIHFYHFYTVSDVVILQQTPDDLVGIKIINFC